MEPKTKNVENTQKTREYKSYTKYKGFRIKNKKIRMKKIRIKKPTKKGKILLKFLLNASLFGFL